MSPPFAVVSLRGAALRGMVVTARSDNSLFTAIEIELAALETLDQLCLHLSTQHQVREIHVQIPASAVMWRAMDLQVANHSELAASIELQVARLQAEHPDSEVRHAYHETQQRLQLAAVPRSLLQPVRAAAKAHQLKIASLLPSPLEGLGFLQRLNLANRRVCLICPDGERTSISVFYAGQREAATTVAAIPFDTQFAVPTAADRLGAETAQDWTSIVRAVLRLALGTTGRIENVLVVVPERALIEQVRRQLARVEQELSLPVECCSPSDVNLHEPFPGRSMLPVGMALLGTPHPLDFSRQQHIRRPFPLALLLSVGAALGLLLALSIYLTWQTQQQNLARTQLEIAVTDLEDQLFGTATEHQQHEFLLTQWDTAPWLPALLALADTAPANTIDVTQIAVETDAAGASHVRFQGQAQDVETVLKWNQRLLDRRSNFELVLHAIDANPVGSPRPHRFHVELEVPHVRPEVPQ